MNIKLIRLATLYFEPIPKNWRSWKLNTGIATVETMGSWELEQKLRILVFAASDLAKQPDLTPEQGIIVPSEPRREIEKPPEDWFVKQFRKSGEIIEDN